MAKKSQGNAFAAITQHSTGLRYLELSGRPDAYKVVRQAVISEIRSGNADTVATHLMSELGSFSVPVVFGLPMRESMVRVIEFPRMPVEEAKQALQWEFDRHFTWSYSECSVDACEVESPLTSKDKMSLLVAACRNEHITKVMQIADRAGMKLKAIEPMNVAVLRAIIGNKPDRKEAWHSMYSDIDGLHFAFVAKDNGLLYRSSPAGMSGIIDANNEDDVQRVISEIQRTISYVTNQFKNVTARTLVLCGAIANNPNIVGTISGSIDLEVETVNVYEQCGIDPDAGGGIGTGFEPALGLCMH
ncbi:MAG: pilus assembly protein PilM [Synergistaceae bacterium]|nr:pilus assembly protein PilM [Synergistaceae bacterium]